ncbi:MAG: helix-turn-helix domain-containing protein [Thermoanaerobaculia bacterium]|nr:helix-turn-helix domain-containing protein [Thermoanaerobaculia bacterium]
MDYVERQLGPRLWPYVECLWDLEASATVEPTVERVVPDGCMELVIHWGDRFAEVGDVSIVDELGEPTFQLQPRALVAGQRELPLFLRSTGHVGVTAARFRPGGALPFLHDRIDLFRSQTVDLEDLIGRECTDLIGKLAGAEHAPGRMDVLEEWLAGRMRPLPATHLTVDRAIALLGTGESRIHGAALAAAAGCSRRTLERRFRERVGLGPGALRRILRLQSVLLHLERRPWLSWAEIAVESGYCDQAHLVRDFRRYTGMKPTDWRGEETGMADFFVDADRLERLLLEGPSLGEVPVQGPDVIT